MREREELELVVRFEDLQAGNVIVAKPCFCGENHRGMLFGPIPCIKGGECFEVEPNPSLSKGHVSVRGYQIVIDKSSVAAGVVWRVVIPPTAETLETSRETERPRPKKLERVR